MTEKLYAMDIKICATAYIKAETKKEAREKASTLRMACIEVDEQNGEVCISGKAYGDPTLPEISLSPAMTVHGPWRKKHVWEAE